MKLLVTGASGYVGTEIIRQSLQLPQVTSVVAVARKPVSVPSGADPARLKSIVVKDYGDYPASGEVENLVFGFEEKHPDLVEAGVARPGLIINDSTDVKEVMARLGKEVTTIKLESVAAALLQQALHGTEKKTLWSDDLKRLAGSQ
ncbi:hypothetical protein BFJ70_g11453 [Fusarium oxysporum]|uniref:NAD(P)-binding domain-containing protein n=1 Tax=Fusarium oxysporum f. sp. cepae TaxID=396571 RepID=A0A3L6N253_FUSOX|nr:hypothetical protein NW765_013106 [Fusarium oxysporum]RKK11519.1 hypothetical protein BFJ65_g13399 [Fusarium oxysporum f. sp. cepae]RKK33478.1 hypothetical protein BFJ67_g14252 [Fusarium oxysporum f. sp. cepae]RKL27590.1 hypothetical protein BFJ70_g11453 [Fusarium oxysporum]